MRIYRLDISEFYIIIYIFNFIKKKLLEASCLINETTSSKASSRLPRWDECDLHNVMKKQKECVT